jgi:hypothetical protein
VSKNLSTMSRMIILYLNNKLVCISLLVFIIPLLTTNYRGYYADKLTVISGKINKVLQTRCQR